MVALFHRLVAAYVATTILTKVLVAVGISVGATAIAVLAVAWMPPDHFSRPPADERRSSRHPLLRWTLFVLKNLVGAVILPMGIIMALPLVPGPGLVFILVGLSLLDFPGKRRLEQRLLAVPSVLKFLNDVRRRFRQPPLIFATPDPGADAR